MCDVWCGCVTCDVGVYVWVCDVVVGVMCRCVDVVVNRVYNVQN